MTGMTELKESRMYPGTSQPFIKYQPGNNGSFAWYPSGRMACAYERMGGGFYCFFYADDQAGTTLCAFDPQGCGYVAFEDGRPRLTSRKEGGTYTAHDGSIERLWTRAKPLKGAAISFEMSNNISFTFKSRREITAKLSCQGLVEEYVLGEPSHTAQTSYVSRSLGTMQMGPERGKKILDIDQIRLAQAQRKEAARLHGTSDLAKFKKGKIRASDVHPECRSIVEGADSLAASVKRGDWNVSVCVDRDQLRSTLGESIPTLKMDASMLRGDPASKRLDGMAATNPETLEAMLSATSFDKGVLPLSKDIMKASGRFRPDHGPHYRTPRIRLRELKSTDYDSFITIGAPKDAVVVVACLASWLPQARRAEAMLEQANSEMHTLQSSGSVPQVLLRKFDMSHSRLLRDRHNVNTLPMYLMYVNGKLAYASNTLNGSGGTKEDLFAQVRMTAADAAAGTFLPEGFKFGLTDNALVESFGKTLSATSSKLGVTT